MNASTVVITGFEVVVAETVKGRTVYRVLSRRYTVKAAAETFRDIACARIPGCYVRAVHGVDEASNL